MRCFQSVAVEGGARGGDAALAINADESPGQSGHLAQVTRRIRIRTTLILVTACVL